MSNSAPIGKWWVCGLLLLALMLNYMDRQTLSLTITPIMEELQLSNTQYGRLEKGFGYAFAVGGILVGLLADKVNVRWLYPVVLLGWSMAGIATGYADKIGKIIAPTIASVSPSAVDPGNTSECAYWGFLVCRVILGLFEAGQWPCALITTQRLLSSADRPFGNSVLQSGASVGAILTPQIVQMLVTSEPGSWRNPYVVVGVLGLLWIGPWLWMTRGLDLSNRDQIDETAHQIFVGEANTKTAGSGTTGLVNIIDTNDAMAFGTADDQTGADTGNVTTINLVGDTGASGTSHDLDLGSQDSVSTITLDGEAPTLALQTTADGPSGVVPILTGTLFATRYAALICVVITINMPWHFFRAWMPKMLHDVHHYEDAIIRHFTSAYYIATDVGCISAGLLIKLLISKGRSVHASRLIVFAICTGLTMLGMVAAEQARGPLLLGLLLMIGFGALGLFPIYYSLTQELSTKHQGKVTGSLSFITWAVTAEMQELVGKRVDATGSYADGLYWVGLAPLIGLIALLVLWQRTDQEVDAP